MINLQQVKRLHHLWLEKSPKGKRADLPGANLRGATLMGWNLEFARLVRTDLREANLAGANLREADLSLADMDEAVLVQAMLDHACLERASLHQANLSGAWLTGANLCCSNLGSAVLTKGCLVNAVIYRANLCTADLTGANLEKADLSYAGLEFANLSDANLMGANFSGANLDYATGLPDAKEWLQKFLTETDEGWLAYHAVYMPFPPSFWKMNGDWITCDEFSEDRRELYAMGIRLSTRNHLTSALQKAYAPKEDYKIYQVLIPFDAKIVVPYATGGDLRTNKIKQVNEVIL